MFTGAALLFLNWLSQLEGRKLTPESLDRKTTLSPSLLVR